MTTPDNPAYENQPSHWNEAHSVNLSGSEVIGAFSNAGNVSFAVETNGRITASANVTAAASPVNVTAGTTSGNLQTIAFSNSNNVSFGLNGSTITASASQSIQTQNSVLIQGSSGSIEVDTAGNLGNVVFVGNARTIGANALIAFEAGTAASNLSSLSFSNANGISFGLGGAGTDVITASHNGLTSQSNQAFSAPGGSSAFQTLVFANSNGVSWSNSNGSVVASVATNYLTTARASNDAIGTNTALTAGPLAWTANSAGLSLNAGSVAGTTSGFTGANISASITHNTAGLALSMSVAAAGGAASETIYAVGNTTVNSSGTFPLSAVSMRGYGIVSLGTSNGSILVSSPDPTTLAPGWYAVGNTTGASSSTTFAADTISIQGTGGVSVGYSNGSLVISGNTGGGGGVTTGGYYALGNTTQNSSTTLPLSAQSFNGLGAMTVGYSNGSIQLSAPATSSLSATGNASLSVNGSTISVGANAAAVSISGNSTSAGAGYSNVSSGTVYFAGGNNITLSQNGASITISGANAGGAQTGISGIVVSNTTYTSGTVTFQNANGISFGSSGANGISASYTVPTQTNQTVGGYFVGNTTGQSSSSTVDARSISFDGGGIVSAGFSAGSIRISATQSNQAASAANGSFAFQTVNFSNANGVSFVTSAGSAIAASVETSYAASNHSHGNPTLNLTNLSGTTASNSAGFTLSLSAAAPGGGGVTPVVSANNGSYSFTTLSFSNANGVSFGTSAGSAVTASYTVPTVTQYFSNTATTFNGANISGSMTLNTNGLQLSMSVAAPGAAAENNAIALLGANTAGNTTATGSTIGWSGVNVTLSGTNASQVVISAPATSSLVGVSGVSVSTNGSTISVYDNVTLSGYLEGVLDKELLAAQIGNAQLFVQPLRLRNHVQFAEICEFVNFSNASNSSNSATLSLLVGFYTRNNSSLSLVTSASSSYAITASGTVGSYSIYGGPREYPIGFTTTLTKGDYYIGFLSRTTTGGGAGMTWSNFVGSNINSAYSGRFSSANNATNQFVLGQGSYTVTTTAIPGSIAFSQINGSAAANLRPVIYKLVSGDLN